MTTFAIAGATTLGSPLTAELRSRGHHARALSRSSDEFPVDLEDGRGLEPALSGVDVVVHAANAGGGKRARPVLVDGTKWLLDAADAHHLCVSVIGIDDVALSYYRLKLEQEALIRASGRPWTIVRCTQFQETVSTVLRVAARWRLNLKSSVPLQPIAASEAASPIASFAEAPARHGIVTVAGPQVVRISDLRLSPRRGVPLPLPMPGKLGRSLRGGALTCQAADVYGTIRFSQWQPT